MSRGDTRSPARRAFGSAFNLPFLLCLALPCLPIFPCLAEARLEASLGFGGSAPPERWVPLRIRCEGIPRGASIRIARLASDGRSLGVEAFPALEGVLLECPAWTSGDLDAVSVDLLSAGRVLAETRIDAKAKPFPGHLVLACGLAARARLAIASALMPVEPVLVLAVEVSDLPSNGLDYDAISAIAIGDETVELSPAQRVAILAWLAGGGRFCAAEGYRGGSALDALGLGPGKGPASYGLGGFVSLSPDRAEIPASWKEALALEPYEPDARLGAGSLARAPESGAPDSGGNARGARAAIAAAAAAWLAAILLAAILGRGKAAPFAAVAAVCLAAVFAGGPALDRAIMRGASVRARALVVPGSGASFIGIGAKAYAPSSSFEWAALRAIGSPSFEYSGEESGVFGEWKHRLAKADFALRAGSSGRLELEAMLGPEEWEGPTAISTEAAAAGGGPRDGRSVPRGGQEPPDAESAYPMAFLASGETGSWWTKDPGTRWAKAKAPPDWLKGEEGWALSLRGGKRSLPFLAGRCPPGSLAFAAEGNSLREVYWVMPLPEGGSR